MYLIIDVETTGLPNKQGLPRKQFPDYKELHRYDNCRVVQLSMMLCDNQFKCIKLEDFIIKPVDFSIDNAEFHGITNEIAQHNGLLLSDILQYFEAHLINITHIIAHNIEFDINVIKSECFRLRCDNLLNIIDSKILICTMHLTKDIVKAKNKYGIKYPSLAELYKFAFNENITNAHNSKYDVINLHKIVEYLHINNIVNIF
jgi:DNA polymerase-3 subunit alpha